MLGAECASAQSVTSNRLGSSALLGSFFIFRFIRGTQILTPKYGNQGRNRDNKYSENRSCAEKRISVSFNQIVPLMVRNYASAKRKAENIWHAQEPFHGIVKFCLTSKVSQTVAWREACESTIRDKQSSWLHCLVRLIFHFLLFGWYAAKQ